MWRGHLTYPVWPCEEVALSPGSLTVPAALIGTHSACHGGMTAAACWVPRKPAHLLPLWHLFLSWGLFPRPKVNTCLPQALRSGNFILSRRPIVERTWTLSQRKCSSGVSTILSPLQGLLAGLGGLKKLPRVVVKNVDSGVNWFQILVLSAVWLTSCVTVYNLIAFYASVSTICEMGVAIVPTSQG